MYRAVVILAIRRVFMFVEAFGWTKQDWAVDYAATKMVEVVLVIRRGDVAPSESLSTDVAKKIEPAEVVEFAEEESVLREELGGSDFVAILCHDASIHDYLPRYVYTRAGDKYDR
jgi:hypothetical protein